jgi:hypothetical protein
MPRLNKAFYGKPAKRVRWVLGGTLKSTWTVSALIRQLLRPLRVQNTSGNAKPRVIHFGSNNVHNH